MLAWCAWRRLLRWQNAVLAALAAAAATGVAVAIFEGTRSAQGLPPFFPEYLGDQVRRSIVEGRHRPAPGEPFFYVEALLRWHVPLLLALPLSAWAFRRLDAGQRRLMELGWVFTAVILVGFTVPVQKSPWYIHPVMFGGALFMGTSLAALPAQRWDRAMAAGAVGLALCGAAFAAWSAAQPARHGDLYAMHHLPPPAFAPGEPNQVADCGTVVGDWRSAHLLDFLWRAERVPCQAPAPYRFAGGQLLRQERPSDPSPAGPR
jgi:hypothetical protein